MNETLTTKSMTKEEVIENLKTMIFGEQAFERFTSDERDTLDRAIAFLEKSDNNFSRYNETLYF